MAGTLPQREPQSQGERSESRQRLGTLDGGARGGNGFCVGGIKRAGLADFPF